MKMKTDWYLKLCGGILQEPKKKDLIEQKMLT